MKDREKYENLVTELGEMYKLQTLILEDIFESDEKQLSENEIRSKYAKAQILIESLWKIMGKEFSENNNYLIEMCKNNMRENQKNKEEENNDDDNES